MIYDLAIIGGGVAGLSAAMYAGRFGLKTVIFSISTGGTIQLTDVVENYPGFKVLTGGELAKKLRDHAMVYKPKIVNKGATKITKQRRCFSILAGKKYKAKSVILATGTAWRRLGVPGAKEFENKGVHFCAQCDGPNYKGKVTAVVGGADSAAKAALALAGIAKKVYIIYRKDKIRPEPINYDRVIKNKKITIINNTNVTEVLGDKTVKGVTLDRKFMNSFSLGVDAVFTEIGHIPITMLASQLKVKLNKKGEVKTDKLMQTSLPGFFAAGDVTDTPFKQAITAASEGCIAAFSAYDYVAKTPLCTYGPDPIKSR